MDKILSCAETGQWKELMHHCDKMSYRAENELVRGWPNHYTAMHYIAANSNLDVLQWALDKLSPKSVQDVMDRSCCDTIPPLLEHTIQSNNEKNALLLAHLKQDPVIKNIPVLRHDHKELCLAGEKKMWSVFLKLILDSGCSDTKCLGTMAALLQEMEEIKADSAEMKAELVTYKNEFEEIKKSYAQVMTDAAINAGRKFTGEGRDEAVESRKASGDARG